MIARKIYTLKEDLLPITDGRAPLPNAKRVDDHDFLVELSSVGHSWTQKWGHSQVEGGYRTWTMYYLLQNQGGQLTGEGYAVVYPGKVWKFAICVHEPVEGAGANHERGWHPATCGKCGMDMSVDSGD